MRQQRSTLARLNRSVRDDGNGFKPFSIKGSSPYTMYTGKGNVIDAGAGDDWASAGFGNDTVHGSDDKDEIHGLAASRVRAQKGVVLLPLVESGRCVDGRSEPWRRP